MTDEPFGRESIVWYDGPFRGRGRPWVVLSDDRHPFHGREYVVCGITTTDRDPAIRLSDEPVVVGGLPRSSYASPWFLTTLRHERIDRGVGALTRETVEAIVDDATRYLGAGE